MRAAGFYPGHALPVQLPMKQLVNGSRFIAQGQIMEVRTIPGTAWAIRVPGETADMELHDRERVEVDGRPMQFFWHDVHFEPIIDAPTGKHTRRARKVGNGEYHLGTFVIRRGEGESTDKRWYVEDASEGPWYTYLEAKRWCLKQLR